MFLVINQASGIGAYQLLTLVVSIFIIFFPKIWFHITPHLNGKVKTSILQALIIIALFRGERVQISVQSCSKMF